MQGERPMRTTLAIDDDVLAAAKGLADLQHKPVGAVVSALLRQALQSQNTSGGHSRNGIPLLPVRPDALPATLEIVNQLRDELP
ncbi:CopG family transcriptional regulator [Acidithiobacillus ferriphilus]|nr:CopG family transcriptional regulator [Acidithiobacillus ferriphilus]MBU2832197.1 CopG family transcriptional regulator [Acidithiobacillus ferriphilus]